MELQLNTNIPTIMHIDLNSCFATVEQQANPFLRGRPVGVAAYTGNSGCIISPSYEAKRQGVKVGFRVGDAKAVCPDIIILPPDPPKYRAVHQMFCRIFKEYAPSVVPKSIDEAVLDFTGTEYVKSGLTDVGKEIKLRMRQEIGEWITCNVGISTNRFLAKTAAALHKPDGLDVITHENVRDVLSRLTLIDLCGINVRYKYRLNAGGIYTPLQFLDTDWITLKKRVFKSIVGYYWYCRLRGWEVDNVEWERKSYGQSYALHKYTSDLKELDKLMMKLCEKMGRRLRHANYYARGIHVGLMYKDRTYWHMGRKRNMKLYSTLEFYNEAKNLLRKQESPKPVTHIMVSCYNLTPFNQLQQNLFDTGQHKRWEVSKALDHINDRYGEYAALHGSMMGMGDKIIDRVPFGGVKELEEIYSFTEA